MRQINAAVCEKRNRRRYRPEFKVKVANKALNDPFHLAA
jgi:hypothetical protein